MAIVHMKNSELDGAVAQLPVAMVDFWASWCGPCKMIGPSIEHLSQTYDQRVFVGKVNVDEEVEAAARFGVMSIPTVIFFKDGKEVDRIVGAYPEEAYVNKLETLLEQ